MFRGQQLRKSHAVPLRAGGAVTKLRAIKTAHTIVWAVFAGCILAIPWFAWKRELTTTLVLIAIVSCEVLVLFANRMRCPLTAVAARYTDDRRDNFDIYLPLWLARYNKLIFGNLFGLGCAYALIQWSTS
jgi:hypothetical protein